MRREVCESLQTGMVGRVELKEEGSFKGQDVWLTLEAETDTLSRNVGKGLPLDAT